MSKNVLTSKNFLTSKNVLTSKFFDVKIVFDVKMFFDVRCFIRNLQETLLAAMYAPHKILEFLQHAFSLYVQTGENLAKCLFGEFDKI